MTARELYRRCVDVLTGSGADSPRTDASELCEHFLGMPGRFAGDTQVSEKAQSELLSALERRAGGYPLQYILGSWSFMDCELSLREGVLIPRDDTEVCVREVLSRYHGGGVMIDLCSGSGAIAIALAKRYPDSVIYAAELSDIAYDCLIENIRLNGTDNVRPVKLDVLTGAESFPEGYFDVIISNPPYIRSDELPSLQREVQYEPPMALDGGNDGLVFYRAIAENWLSRIRSGGIISLETGEEQGEDVSRMLSASGVADIRIVKDLGGLDRAVVGTVQ